MGYCVDGNDDDYDNDSSNNNNNDVCDNSGRPDSWRVKTEELIHTT